MASKRNARFKVGQVVMVLREMEPVKLVRIGGDPFDDGRGNMFAVGGKDLWYHESELRPLTAREKGGR